MLKFEVSFFSILSVIEIKQSNLINIQINDYNHYHYFDDALKLFFIEKVQFCFLKVNTVLFIQLNLFISLDIFIYI